MKDATTGKYEATSVLMYLCIWPATGLLLWAAFWLPVLVWVALVPLGTLIHKDSGRRPYLAAWMSGLGFFLPGTHWLSYSDPSAWLGWLLLAVYLSLYFPAFVYLARATHRRLRLPILLAMPISWVALEYVRMYALSGFGWLLLAHPLHQWITMIQIADIAGVYGVSFLVALVNGLLAELFVLYSFDTRPGSWKLYPSVIWRSAVAIGAVLGVWIYGMVRIHQTNFHEGPRSLLIHTDIGQSLKDQEPNVSLQRTVRSTYESLGKMISKNQVPDLVIWPETSFNFWYGYGDIAEGLSDLDLARLRIGRRAHVISGDIPQPSAEMGSKIRKSIEAGRDGLDEITGEIDVPLLVGTLRNDFRSDRFALYNSSVLFVPGKGGVTHYDKIHLVPFGEYLPLEEWLPWLKFLTPYEAGIDYFLDSSSEYQTLHHQRLHFASLICFEDTLPHLARAFLRREEPDRPIEFLVNQSNDGWFRGTKEADLHLAASLFRCIECRVPMVRVCNGGVTALIDGNGALVKVFSSEDRAKNGDGGMDVIIPLDDRRSVYVIAGDWLCQLCGVIVCIALVLGIMSKRSSAQIP